jgi:hypothetical protein
LHIVCGVQETYAELKPWEPLGQGWPKGDLHPVISRFSAQGRE